MPTLPHTDMHVVLVHGWGFSAALWDPLIAHLPDAKVTTVDLGFLAVDPLSVPDWPEHAIAIGHSLGVLWLLRQDVGTFSRFVSIQGFDQYCPHVPPVRVLALKRGLARDPGATLAAFWRSCGAPDYADPSALNVPRLAEGLDWLMQWNAEAAKKSLECPLLCLASRDDVIVPPAMSEAIWGIEKIIWSPGGGHVLPLKRPDWVAQHVLEFANSVPPQR